MAVAALRRLDFRFEFAFDWRDPRVKQVLRLMLPVCIGLGIINVDLLINSLIGTLVSDQAPRAIDAAFRIYMLPQGMFSVALATVLFPMLSRLAARRDFDLLRATMSVGLRQIFLLLIPAAVATLVLSRPIVRLVYEHGAFGPRSTDKVSLALFWFSFSLPFAGVNLLLTRTFFSLQQPWTPTLLAGANIIVNVAIGFALYKPFGIAAPVIGTAVASAGMTVAQAVYLRRALGGSLEGARMLSALARMGVAAAALAGVAYGVWAGLDAAFGRSVPAQIASVGVGLSAGAAAYAAVALALRGREAEQIRALVLGRLRSGAA
jgi:putative peptidoglycan lipid II flippase